MIITTANIQVEYVEVIKTLVGENGLYPSRSELIRCAVKDLLVKELLLAQNMARQISNKKYQLEMTQPEIIDPSKYVQIPIDSEDADGEPIRDFKTYKIVRRLEIN